MKKIYILAKKTACMMVVIIFSLFTNLSPLIASASVGPTEAYGPTEPTGPQGPVGPTGPTGPIEEVTQTEELTNSTTGADSINENSTTTESDTSVVSDNNVTTDNDVTLDLNSGQNNIQSNNSVGSLATGDIDGSVNLINVSGSSLASGSSVGASILDGSTIGDFEISENNIPLRLLFPSSDFSLGNSATGSDSLNTNNIDNHNVVSFITDNDVLRDNTIDINANTGENNISSNTSIGQISTGDIGLGVNVINLDNLFDPYLLVQLDIWSILNGLNGDIILPAANLLTGADSENSNIIDSATSVSADVTNDINNTNSFDVTTNTGKNTLEKNSAIGNIVTGTANVAGSITNITDNAPVFYIINVFGKFLGNVLTSGKNFLINQIGGSSISGTQDDIAAAVASSTTDVSASNELTGESSLNENTVDTSNELNLDVDNNIQNNNKIKINANTGGNKLTENTLVQGLKTGSINVISNVINATASMLGSLRNMKIRIINIFGDWNGNLCDKDEDQIPTPDDNCDTGSCGAGTDEEVIPPSSPVITTVKTVVPAKVISAANIEANNALLPMSGISWGEENIISNENKASTKKIPLYILIPASILFVLSLTGQLLLKKKYQ